MSANRTTFRSTILAIAAAAFGAALLAGPAGARPIEGPLVHPAHQVLVASAPGSYHDSIASVTGATPTYHDSIAPTSAATSVTATRVAPPTSADSAYREASAGAAAPVQRATVVSNFRGFNSNPKVLAATTHSTTSSISGSAWAAIGGGLLLMALIAVAAAGLARRSQTPRRRTVRGTPSFGA